MCSAPDDEPVRSLDVPEGARPTDMGCLCGQHQGLYAEAITFSKASGHVLSPSVPLWNGPGNGDR